VETTMPFDNAATFSDRTRATLYRRGLRLLGRVSRSGGANAQQ
jgi:hypothetical protein